MKVYHQKGISMKTIQFLLLILAVFLCANQAGAGEKIHYRIVPGQPNAHVLHIEMKAPVSQQDFTDFRMPAWRPGRYVTQNFARNVLKFHAHDENNLPLDFKKIDKDTWRVQSGSSKFVTAKYEYYANEFDAGNTYFDDREIYLNPITCLMYIPGRELEQVDLFVENKQDWPVASALNFEAQTGIFSAPIYHELADNPVVISAHLSRIKFTIDNTAHEIIMLGEYWYDENKIIADFKKMIEKSAEIFGEIPAKKYVFFFHLVDYRSSHGVEHKNSTSIVTGPANFHSSSYNRQFLGVTTHEYFHLWNVERIRPDVILHPDYSTEKYTETMWFFEGGTSYYTPLILRRAELITPEKFIKESASAINEYRKNYGRKVTSAAHSSFDTWTHSVGRTPPNSQLSFYLNGKIICMALDLEIRQRTKNDKSLDDVLRDLWLNYGKDGIGMPENGIQKSVEKIAGTSFNAFFNDYVYDTKTVDFERYLGYAGFEVVHDLKKDSSKTYTGLQLSGDKKQTIISNVTPHSPAWKAGIDIRDILIAINGRRIHPKNFKEFVGNFTAGDSLKISVLRKEYLREFTLKLESPPDETRTIKIIPMDKPNNLQAIIQKSWAGKINAN
ncbi:MAG: M61 family peptidase [Calditrichaeota bacterium]|nr:MAG: M61 family peptidase [Calditrichota bacterium]